MRFVGVDVENTGRAGWQNHFTYLRNPELMHRCLINCPATGFMALGLLTATAIATDGESPPVNSAVVRPMLELKAEGSQDQDDMCVWVHQSRPDQSLIITADKAAGQVFVYDLNGDVLQAVDVPKPGNIDLRDNVMLNGQPCSLVVCNQRDKELRLRVFKVDPSTRTLRTIDDGRITTDANYGGCLYHSKKTAKLYFISTTKENGVSQYELFENATGTVSGRLVRDWTLGKSEGAVADDKAGVVYIGEEERGIWKLGAEPDAPTPGELVIRIGEHGLKGDIEGLAIAKVGDQRLLIASDQGSSNFLVLNRDDSYRPVGRFSCIGAKSTDGIEVVDIPLGPKFPQGLFCCHTDADVRPTLVSSWHTVLELLNINAVPLQASE